MNIAVFMETFPALSETYLLWHMTELVKSGQQLGIYPVKRGSTEKMHDEVTRHDLLARVHAPPAIDLTRLEGKVSAGVDILSACALHPREMVRLYGLTSQTCKMGWPQVARHVKHLGTELECDVMHGYFGPPGRRAQMLRETLDLDVPLVVSFLGFDLNVLPKRTPANYYERVFERADALCVSSQFMKRQILALGAPEDRVRILPLGLPVKRFDYQPRKAREEGGIRLVSAARLTEVKGLEWGMRGVALARDAGVDVTWHILGDGPLRQELEALRDELGLADRVVFHGFVKMEEVRAQMARSDVSLFPGVAAPDGAEEALGGAVLEAQACGMPVIASDVGGIPEAFVPGESGVLVPQRDAEAIAEAILRLASQGDTWEAMGERGRAHIEQQFDCEALNARWLELYEELRARRSER